MELAPRSALAHVTAPRARLELNLKPWPLERSGTQGPALQALAHKGPDLRLLVEGVEWGIWWKSNTTRRFEPKAIVPNVINDSPRCSNHGN